MSLRVLPHALTFGALAFAISAIAAPPAQALTTFATFYEGGTGYTGPYAGTASVPTVYFDTKLLPALCPLPGGCGSPTDNIRDPLNFTTANGFGIAATAGPDSSTVNMKVWDDLSPPYGGLGVGTGSPSDSDQIAGTDVLTLKFSQQVTLTGVGTLFASGHTPFGDFANAPSGNALNTIEFLLSVDGGAFNSVKFLDANLMHLSRLGTTFAFMEKTYGTNPEYYVSALSFDTCGPPGTQCGPGQVPIPGALPLFFSGVGLFGGLVYRRKRKTQVAAA